METAIQKSLNSYLLNPPPNFLLWSIIITEKEGKYYLRQKSKIINQITKNLKLNIKKRKNIFIFDIFFQKFSKFLKN
jgi:hypothetical protein